MSNVMEASRSLGFLFFSFSTSFVDLSRASLTTFFLHLLLHRQLGLCLVSMVALFAFTEVLHPVLFLDATSQEVRLPFLPRLLTSVVCGLYLFAAWGLSALVLWWML
jgi:uncharacterized membrane protein YbhN (UPF0104 family)